MKDLSNKHDLDFLLRAFYSKALMHPVLKEKFEKLDMDHHIPIIASFWAGILFFEQDYKGNPFLPHKSMGLEKSHFQSWLKLLNETLDEHFAGDTADEMKKRAGTIAEIFRHKLGID